MQIREYGDDDEDAVTALATEQDPTADPMLVSQSLRTTQGLLVRYVAGGEGDAVGVASLMRPGWLAEPDVGINILVASGRRGRGIGTALWQTVRPHLSRGSVAYGEVADKEPRALTVVQHWGFSVYRHHVDSTIGFNEAPATSVVPHDVTFRYLASLQGVVDDALDAMMRAADTSPEAAETGGLGLRELATVPSSFAVIADVDGSPVGYSVAQQTNTTGWVLMTATSPSARRRGIGRAVKEALHAYGYERGVRRFGTRNETSNEAIRRLNEALGYTVVSGTSGVRQQF